MTDGSPAEAPRGRGPGRPLHCRIGAHTAPGAGLREPGAEVVDLRAAAGLSFEGYVGRSLVRGLNDDEVVDFATFARERKVIVRFIEFMPLDADRNWTPELVVPADEVVKRINEVYPLVAIGRESPSSTSRRYRFADGEGEILRSRAATTVGVELAAQYEQGLARLKPEEREAIIGRVEMGFTYEELAEATGKPSSEAARKAAQRALVRLVEEMECEGR